MVSIFDYNKDDEARERAREAPAEAPAAEGVTAERNLSDGGVQRGCGREEQAGGSEQLLPCGDWRGMAGWLTAAPGWGLATVLLGALAWVKRERLRSMVTRGAHPKRRLVFAD